jgi:hypothetical protein
MSTFFPRSPLTLGNGIPMHVLARARTDGHGCPRVRHLDHLVRPIHTRVKLELIKCIESGPLRKIKTLPNPINSSPLQYFVVGPAVRDERCDESELGARTSNNQCLLATGVHNRLCFPVYGYLSLSRRIRWEQSRCGDDGIYID